MPKTMLLTLEAQGSFHYYDNNYAIATTVKTKDNDASLSIMYQVYERGDAWKEQYVMVKAEKNFQFENLGKVAIGLRSQVSLQDSDDSTFMATMKFGGGQ